MHHRDGRALHSANIRRAPDISVIVVNYNTAHLLGELFAALEASRGALKLQLIVDVGVLAAALLATFDDMIKAAKRRRTGTAQMPRPFSMLAV